MTNQNVDMMGQPVPPGWHVNKNIPIAFLFTILLQTAAAGWFLSNMHSDVEDIKKTLTEFSEDQKAEELRQWNRINKAENGILLNTSENRLTRQLIESIEKEAETTNDILRQILKNSTTQR